MRIKYKQYDLKMYILYLWNIYIYIFQLPSLKFQVNTTNLN